MHHVAAGKYTGDLGFHIFIYHGPLGVGVHGNTCLAGQLVFGDQPHTEQDGIHVKLHLGSRDRAAVFIHLGNDGFFHSLFALNFHNGVG